MRGQVLDHGRGRDGLLWRNNDRKLPLWNKVSGEVVLICHVSVGTKDVECSKRFYDAVTHPRIVPMAGDGLVCGSGAFHFRVQVPIDGKPVALGDGTHIACAVEGHSMVDRFCAAALKHGDRDDGVPGLRPSCDANYHGRAFMRDPDGHRPEAVTSTAK